MKEGFLTCIARVFGMALPGFCSLADRDGQCTHINAARVVSPEESGGLIGHPTAKR